MSKEAMEQALDVIETYSPEYMHGLPKKHYTKLLRKAIEEAEKPAQQEPPRPQAREPLLREIAALSANALDDYKIIQKLMAERQPMTDEQIWEIVERSEDNLFSFARAIEAAHGIKEKNT